jgi:hypothetical protein
VVSRSVLLVGATLAGVFAANALEAQALKDVQTPDTPLVLKAQGNFFVGGESVEQTQSGRPPMPSWPSRDESLSSETS